MSVDLSLDQFEHNGCAVLSCRGEIDLSTAPRLHGALWKLIDGNVGNTVIIDCDGVTSMDHTGLGLLVGAMGRATSRSVTLEFVINSTWLRDLFANTKLDQIVTIRTRLTRSG